VYRTTQIQNLELIVRVEEKEIFGVAAPKFSMGVQFKQSLRMLSSSIRFFHFSDLALIMKALISDLLCQP